VDGEENPYTIIEFARIQEVQKYLSVTNHMWDGWWFLANADAWKALPPDIQAVVERNVAQYVRDERRDVMRLNVSLAAKLRSQGMIFNTTDISEFKPKLKSYYAKWKSTYGTVAWSALEKTTGQLA
jgi:TRAP-type C4-dicarboxylate transport system substrate-binding protein